MAGSEEDLHTAVEDMSSVEVRRTVAAVEADTLAVEGTDCVKEVRKVVAGVGDILGCIVPEGGLGAADNLLVGHKPVEVQESHHNFAAVDILAVDSLEAGEDMAGVVAADTEAVRILLLTVSMIIMVRAK